MKHKTWFRLVLKAIGVLLIGLTIPTLADVVFIIIHDWIVAARPLVIPRSFGRPLIAIHHDLPLSAVRRIACKAGLAASTEVESRPIGAPVRSVITPPASRTTTVSAAMSRIFRSDSITASSWPEARRW